MNSLYLHIPYCKTRCGYCDFHSSTCLDNQDAYIEALCLEMEMQQNYLPSREVETIYLGGGTPSLLSIAQLEVILTSVHRLFKVSNVAEITIEANPDDLSLGYLKALRRIGFNRISIGIQSFNDEDLKLIGRRHNGAQAIQAIKDAQAAGFSNISGDLIFGLPNQTLEKLKENLEILFALNIQHLSCYSLSYEEGTSFFKKLQAGELKEVDEQISLEMYRMVVEKSKANGFIHYETSNYALDGFYSRHNSNYWNETPYLGLGAGAHSYNGQYRQWNTSNNRQYINAIKNKSPLCDKEEINLRISYNDYIITRLRTIWGCSLSNLEIRFGEELLKHCLEAGKQHLQAQNLIINGDTLTIAPEAIFISDQIMADLLWVD